MGDIIKDIILMIKNMDQENLFGQMVINIQDNGKMENSMEKDYILEKIAQKNKEYAKMEIV